MIYKCCQRDQTRDALPRRHGAPLAPVGPSKRIPQWDFHGDTKGLRFLGWLMLLFYLLPLKKTAPDFLWLVELCFSGEKKEHHFLKPKSKTHKVGATGQLGYHGHRQLMLCPRVSPIPAATLCLLNAHRSSSKQLLGSRSSMAVSDSIPVLWFFGKIPLVALACKRACAKMRVGERKRKHVRCLCPSNIFKPT